MDGWVSIHRQIQNHKCWKDKPFTRGQAWIDLILSANHKDNTMWKRGISILIKRGQVGVSIKGLADRWGWSQSRVKRFLEVLKNEDQIEYQINNITTLILLTNYDQYQSERRTERRPNEDQTKTNNNDNNDNKKKPSLKMQLFDKFWKEYPKKKSKGQAETTWKKIKPDEMLFNKIVSALSVARNSREWNRAGGQYIPYPSTWLNAKGWEDEYEQISEFD